MKTLTFFNLEREWSVNVFFHYKVLLSKRESGGKQVKFN